MAIMGFNAGAEMSQLRTQQTLAAQASAPAAAAPAAAAAPSDGAAATGAAGDAGMGAMAVQEPPSATKTILQGVLRGALTGASVTLGVGQLAKIPFIGNLIGKLPLAGAAGAGMLGFMAKIPVVGGLLGKVAPIFAKGGLPAFAITALAGAAVGAIFGGISGARKAKADAAAYAEAMAAQQAQQQQPPVGDPVNTPAPDDAAAPPPAGPPRFKSWIIARSGNVGVSGGSYGHYKARKGDTIEMLAKRFYTTPAEIRKLNPDLGKTIEPGEKIKLKRRVVPTAQAWSKRAS